MWAEEMLCIDQMSEHSCMEYCHFPPIHVHRSGIVQSLF